MTAALERPSPAVISDARQQFHEDVLSLAAVQTAAGCARALVRADLHAWGAGYDTIEPAELLVSELVTHAVKATGVIEPAPSYCHVYESMRFVRIRLRLFSHRVVIEVWDSSPLPPMPQRPALDADGGSGLRLVASMSSACGYYYTNGGGKVIWCELPVRSAVDEASESPRTLPRRQPGRRTRSTRVMNDLQTLRWVRDRLREPVCPER